LCFWQRDGVINKSDRAVSDFADGRRQLLARKVAVKKMGCAEVPDEVFVARRGCGDDGIKS
jgi:hypothetical protein